MTSNKSQPSSDDGSEAELRYQVERLLARASLVSQGLDSQLDKVLSELRQYLRGQERSPDRLRGFQERLDSELERLDDHVGRERRDAARVLGRLLDTAGRSSLAGAGDLKRLSRELGPRGLPREALLPWIESFADAVDQALPGNGTGGERSPGLLGRFFQRGASERSQSQASDLAPPAGELDLETADNLPPEDDDQSQRLRIARRVGELMGRVMHQVELPPDTHRRAALLKARLSDQQDWALLRQSLDETADLVIAVVSHSQREFQGFLQRLDERLSSLHVHVTDQTDAMAGRQSAAEAMEQTVQGELSELGHSLVQHSDLEGLRASVSRHIERIASTVQVYRVREQERDEQLADQMEAMREKLVAMETHCEQVREQLAQERARALTDILTQLPNRESWDERLRFEHERWQRYGHPVALAVLDIDNFKQVNDSFGHKAGDRVIQLVARALRERLRTTDFVARYGGEEFVVLLPETSLDQAIRVIDSLRQHVAEMPFHFQRRPVAVTFSAGVSWFREGSAPDRVFDEADKALYQAKSDGRNRVVGARGLTW
ncbi:GGDEF domain-containing protein [Marinobacter segnicrescens]|uniref:GGDEF domain-containing protein n=1 Tax=Marinobacter segnicrescens TaxID=430453 RepID=UPI003A8D6FA7